MRRLVPLLLIAACSTSATTAAAPTTAVPPSTNMVTAILTTTTSSGTTTTRPPSRPTSTVQTTTTADALEFTEGVYIVGDEFPPGVYRFAGYMARLDENQEIIANEIFDVDAGFGVMRVLDTDSYVDISDYAIALEDTRNLDPIGEGFTQGTYLVGVDIAPGRYRITPVDDRTAYWARLDQDQEIIDNDIADGQLIVVVRESDWALTINGSIEEA